MTAIDFHLYSPHEIAVWAPVVRQLKARGVDARWVMEPADLNKAETFIDGMNQKLVDDVVVETVVRMLADIGETPLFVGRYDVADAAVTTGWSTWLSEYRGLKFKTGYGVAPVHNSVNFSAFSSNFDTVFAHGPLTQERLQAFSPREDIVVCGFPKYSPYLRGEVDVESQRRQWGLDPALPTLLYCSTWAENSSLDRFAAAISNVAEHYNVLYKPHHCNMRWETNRYEYLRHHRNVVVDERERSIVPYIAVADVVLADIRSGSFTEPFLMNTPVIGLSSGDLTKDCLIEEVNVEQASWICRDPLDLEQLIGTALARDDKGDGRARLSNYLFGDIGAEADVVTAELMLERIGRARANGRIDTSTSTRATGAAYSSQNEMTVVVRGDETAANLLQTLESLNNQTAPAGTFDVVIADSLPGRNHSRNIDPLLYDYDLRFEQDRFIHVAMNNAAESSEARILLFLDGDTRVDVSFIEKHLALHIDRAEATAVRGSRSFFERESVGLLDRFMDSFDAGGPQTGSTSESTSIGWIRFRIANTSMLRESFGKAGGFRPDISSFAQDMALAARLKRAGVSLLQDPSISTVRLRPSDVDAVRSDVVDAFADLVDVVHENEWMLTDPELTWIVNDTQDILVQAEHLSRGIGSDWTITARAIASSSPAKMQSTGANLEPHVSSAFTTIMSALVDMWTRMGTLRGLRKLDAPTMMSLAASSTTDARWPFNTDRAVRYVAWPDFGSDRELEELMEWLPRIASDGACLVVRHDRHVDIDSGLAIARLQRAYDASGSGLDVDVLVFDDELPSDSLKSVGRACTAQIALASSSSGVRMQFLHALDLPTLQFSTFIHSGQDA